VTAATTVPFLNLRPGPDRAGIRAAIERVLDRGWFVLGPEVEAFEAEFAAACGAAHAVGVATGTDAITLALRAAGIGPGDHVIVPAVTAAYTGLAVIGAGAVPIVVDVEPDTLTIAPDACAAAITPRTRAIVPVHLYGQAARGAALMALAERHRLVVVEDCAQAHLATDASVPVGTRGIAGAFSFYPTKNLGAMGDAGAVVTSDAALAARVRLLRNGGQTTRYYHEVAGVNSRLDELQAAVLRVRLLSLPQRTARRRELAARYRQTLGPAVTTLAERDAGHVYHLFVVRTPRRDALRAHLAHAGIETLIHYPVPLSAQPAFAPYGPLACPVASIAANEVLSLPLHPGLSIAEVEHVAAAVNAFEKGQTA
jgi:dTDP-3-amino-3,4,6-trideoxy-alpha-D-glucose transaminase